MRFVCGSVLVRCDGRCVRCVRCGGEVRLRMVALADPVVLMVFDDVE